MNLRKILAVSMILCMVLVGGSVAASAANYPNRAISIIVPFAAGGSTDLMARVLAPVMSSLLGGVDIIIENRAGGGGAIAMVEIMRAAPDGYTIILASANSAVFTPILSDVGYSNEDIVAIAQVSELPTNVFVQADSDIKTVEDLLRIAEERKLTYSTSGAGSLHHVVAELFQHVIGKPGLLTHVPYNSGTESITAVIGGHVDMAFANASYGETYVKQQDLLKVIATTGENGCAILPEVPSFKSLGYDVTLSSWFGMMARTGTPQEIIDLIDKSIREALTDTDLLEAFDKIGQTADYIGSTEFAAKYSAQYEQMRELLKIIF